jgi:peptidoglycan-associated lipoprotein
MKHLTSCTLALVSMLALVAGCESPSKLAASAAPVESRSPVSTAGVPGTAGAAGAAAAGTSQSGVSTVDLAAPRSAAAGAAGTALMAAPSQRVVYFDFDSFVIKDEFKGLLDSHAKVLARSSGKHMVIEGHTDERGGREYNLALGQKRAESVLKSLTLLGVPESQLEAVSFGEEKPAATGSDESAWALNRRAELKDR